MITYGTNPGMGIGITAPVPAPDDAQHGEGPALHGARGGQAAARARPSTWSSSAAAPTRASPICGPPPACSRGRKVAPGVRALVVPGSQRIKKAGRGRGARPGVPGGRRRVARGRLLDVHRHERRPAVARPIRRQHLEPQLRGPAGRRRPHLPGQPRSPPPPPPSPARSPTPAPSPRDPEEERNGAPTWNPSSPFPRRPSSCRSKTSTPTRSSRPASSRSPRKVGHRQAPVRRLALRRRRRPQARLHPQPARGGRRRRPGRRRQLRLRLFARARPLGAARLRLPGRRQHLDRRHLPEQRPQERPAAPSSSTRRSHARLLAAPGETVTVSLEDQTLDPARRHAR